MRRSIARDVWDSLRTVEGLTLTLGIVALAAPVIILPGEPLTVRWVLLAVLQLGGALSVAFGILTVLKLRTRAVEANVERLAHGLVREVINAEAFRTPLITRAQIEVVLERVCRPILQNALALQGNSPSISDLEVKLFVRSRSEDPTDGEIAVVNVQRRWKCHPSDLGLPRLSLDYLIPPLFVCTTASLAADSVRLAWGMGLIDLLCPMPADWIHGRLPRASKWLTEGTVTYPGKDPKGETVSLVTQVPPSATAVLRQLQASNRVRKTQALNLPDLAQLLYDTCLCTVTLADPTRTIRAITDEERNEGLRLEVAYDSLICVRNREKTDTQYLYELIFPQPLQMRLVEFGLSQEVARDWFLKDPLLYATNSPISRGAPKQPSQFRAFEWPNSGPFLPGNAITFLWRRRSSDEQAEEEGRDSHSANG